jgi:hypothetical protein
LRGKTPAARLAAQTHCKRGHQFTPETIIWLNGGRWRKCGVCANLDSLARNRRRRAENRATEGKERPQRARNRDELPGWLLDSDGRFKRVPLDEDLVRRLAAGGVSQRELARRFGTSRNHIKDVVPQ